MNRKSAIHRDSGKQINADNPGISKKNIVT